MSTNPWPPEGTRVRIRDGSFLDGCEARYDGESSVDKTFHWLTARHNGSLFYLLAERHEIEVIDE